MITWFDAKSEFELVFLCPMNLIRGVVEGKDFVRPVLTFVFLKRFPETFLCHYTALSTLYMNLL